MSRQTVLISALFLILVFTFVNASFHNPKDSQQAQAVNAVLQSIECIYEGPSDLPLNHYLRHQQLGYVGKVLEILCVTFSKTDVRFGIVGTNKKAVSKVCPAYPGPDGKGATIQCPTAAADSGYEDKESTIVCWNEAGRCGTQYPNGDSSGVESKEETADEKNKKIIDELSNENLVNENDLLPDGAEVKKYNDVSLYDDTKYNSVKTDAGGNVYACNGNLCQDLGGYINEAGNVCFDSSGCARMDYFKNYIAEGKTMLDVSNDGITFAEGGASGDLSSVLSGYQNPISANTGLVQTVAFDVPEDGSSVLSSIGNKNTGLTKNVSYSPPGSESAVLSNISTPLGDGSHTISNVSPVIVAQDGSARLGNSFDLSRRTSSSGIGVASRGGSASNNTQLQSQINSYESLRAPQNLQNPQSFIQQFAGGDGILDRLSDFVTGGQATLRNTPEGIQSTNAQQQVVYVTAEYATPTSINREFKTIQEIASDIAAQAPVDIARVDHFAQTLSVVGGPSTANTENKAFGRIQDLIVEDEAIRALRVAEEEGTRAKNAVFCRANEAAEECQARREERAQEVERKKFVEELEKRVLPDSAIQHFLAVYDGWIRPSPAPHTYATSTLGVLHSQDNNQLAEYEITTGGNNFVLWIIESVSDATKNAVTKLTNLITNNSGEETSTTDN